MSSESIKSDCLVCQRIQQIQNKTNIYFICELDASYVVLGDSQYFKGYTLLLSKTHTNELHKLDKKTRELFLKEMALVSEAVYNTFLPRKLNYELLGNTDEHMHWHLFPRYASDTLPHKPIWVIDESIRNNPNARPSDSELEEMKYRILYNIEMLRKD